MDITEKSSVSSMTNALRLLNLFTMDEPEWTLSDLAEALNVGVQYCVSPHQYFNP